jgi:hypothetical protein
MGKMKDLKIMIDRGDGEEEMSTHTPEPWSFQPSVEAG